MTRLFIKMGGCGLREGCLNFRGGVSCATPRNCETRVPESHRMAMESMNGDVEREERTSSQMPVVPKESGQSSRKDVQGVALEYFQFLFLLFNVYFV